MRVVIVGGGVFGCSAAYQLAKAGASTTVLERDGFGDHASGRNPGNLNPILGSSPKLAPLALESFRLHLTLAEELAERGIGAYGLEPVKRVLVAFDAKDRDELDTVERQFAGTPSFSTTRLSGAMLQAIEPRLSGAAQEGLLIEGNKSLDSRAFHLAIAAGAQVAGTSIVRDTVLGVSSRAGTVSAVHTSSREYLCDAIVLATGPWVAETSRWLGLDIPVVPVKGEMLRLRLAGSNISHDYTHGLISIYRRGDSEAWVGVTREDCGFDESPTEQGRRSLIDGAARIMPAIRDAVLIEHLAALRPMASSGLPIAGRATGWNNVFIANGGGIKGMLLCTGVGAAIRDLVMTGATTMPVPVVA